MRVDAPGERVKYVNVHPNAALSFECGGTDYVVVQGGVVEIPDRFAYAVALMGLQLKEYSETSARSDEATDADKKQSSKK